MKPSEREVEAMRAAFVANAEANADAGAEAGGSLPTPDEMWAVVVGEVRGDAARAVLDQVVSSPQAQLEWRLTVAMVREAGLEVVVAQPDETDESVAESAQPPGDELAARRTRSRRRVIAWAGAAVAAAAIVFLVLPPRSDESDVPPVPRVMPRASIVSAMPRDAISLDKALVLRWKGGADDARFDVRVTDGKLRVVDAAFNVAERQYTVPAAKLRSASGDVIYWRVVGTSPSGERIESPTFTLRVQR